MKKNLLLLFGGKSVEHEISIRSAKNVYANINRDKYEVNLIGITKNGDWFKVSAVHDQISTGDPICIDINQSHPQIKAGKETIKPDIVFPILHGTDGEDGGIQGFFKVLGIPVVGSDVLGSAVAMDKIVSKRLWQQAGLPVAAFKSLNREELLKATYQELSQEFGDVFMIKAGNLGSSVGVSKITNEENFKSGVADSLTFSNEVMIESYVKGRELECAILGNEKTQSTLPGEIILNKDYDFYSYAAKYEDEHAIEITIPAQLPDDVSDDIRAKCEQAFKIANCCDYGRVDLFLTEDQQVIINEINTIPGFTNVSMFPMLWKQMGLDYPQLIDTIIDLCMERAGRASELSTSFKD